MEFIYHPGPYSLIVAALAGAAGMLSMISHRSSALVGVFISVTTVPAAGYVAVAWVLGEYSKAAGSAMQLALNLVGIVTAAAAVLLFYRLIGVRVSLARRPSGSGRRSVANRRAR
ncbi:putative membrane protein [Paenarthrobacter sp. 4246]